MKARFILPLALLLLCAGAALAQTPDGVPPSLETVCDTEQGAAYGLCTAYCEAMDCDSPNAQASATACAKVKEKFANITGRSLPCDGCPVPPPGTTCPCVAAFPDFANLVSQPLQCRDFGLFVIGNLDEVRRVNGSCNPINITCGVVVVEGAAQNLFDLSLEEGSACYYLIREACNATPE